MARRLLHALLLWFRYLESRDGLFHRNRRLEPIIRGLCQCSEDHVFPGLWEVRTSGAGMHGRLVDVFVGDGDSVAPREGRFTGDQVIQKSPQRVDVGPRVDALPLDLLW